MSVRNYNRKSKALILSLLLLIVVFLVFFGLFFQSFELLITIGIPIVVIIAIGIIIIKLSWNPQNYCTRCNYPVSIYAEFCKNCGLKLISRCPNCDNYIRVGLSQCKTCGYILETEEHKFEPQKFEILQKGSKLPSKPNFCPTCGASLKNAENIRFCEYCGSRIK
jgi:predicted amidophosphoribosyltransferase